jgi:hypothetical protein
MVSKEIRQLIRQISRDNPLWGAPRIHGELLKLGIDIGETSVGKTLYAGGNHRRTAYPRLGMNEHHALSKSVCGTLSDPTTRLQQAQFGDRGDCVAVIFDSMACLHRGINSRARNGCTSAECALCESWLFCLFSYGDLCRKINTWLLPLPPLFRLASVNSRQI